MTPSAAEAHLQVTALLDDYFLARMVQFEALYVRSLEFRDWPDLRFLAASESSLMESASHKHSTKFGYVSTSFSVL